MSPRNKTSDLRPKRLQMGQNTTASVSATSVPASPPTLLDFVSSTPPSLTYELVALAPYIRAIRCALEIASWESSWEESWLALGAWWALCLLSEPMLKFFFPLAILFVFALRGWSSQHGPPIVSPPATETTVHAVLSDLTTIHALLPSSPLSTLPLPPYQTLFRVAAIAYVPYLILTYFVPLHICIAMTGTFVFIHRAAWAHTAYDTLARSAHLRWGFYHLRALLCGTPLPTPASPPPAYASRPVSCVSTYTSALSELAHDSAEPVPAPPVRFLFTVYENQRWWMGLDWTEALLPGERPPWCGPTHAPLPPPATFALPPQSEAYVALPGGARARRVAQWAWEEPEWRVVVRREGQPGTWRVKKAPPRDKGTVEDAAGTAARVLRAARPRDLGGYGQAAGEGEAEPGGEQHVDEPATAAEDEVTTDQEGWVYGDNKWEAPSSRGGIGKYTRYRRWTRIARLTESVESVGPGEVGIVRHSVDLSGADSASVAGSSSSDLDSLVTAPELAKESYAGGTWSSLRQRFKA